MGELIDVCAEDDLPPGAIKTVEWEDIELMVVNCGGDPPAREARCPHDTAPPAGGEAAPKKGPVKSPRHGSLFDLRSGKPLTLPAYVPVETFPVTIEDGIVRVEVE